MQEVGEVARKGMRRCIWRLVEDELIKQYQQNLMQDAETKGILKGKQSRTYVLSLRKLKRTSGVSCCATVSEFRGYCVAYSHWKFQQTPVMKKSVPVTPEVCNKAWREGIVTLPDLTTRSGRNVGQTRIPDG